MTQVFNNILKRKETCRSSRLLCLLLALISLSPLSAKSPRKSDYVNLGLNAGYSALAGKSSDINVTGGFTSGLHIGYEYREGTFWFGGGGEFQYLSSLCSSDVSITSVYFSDTRYLTGLMHYNVLSKRNEMQNFGLAHVYLMAGYCLGNNNKGGFYVGGGVKVGSKFDLSNTTRLKYSTSASYDRYIDDFEDMPNHYYTVNDVSDTVRFGTNVCFSVIGELGWDMKVDRCNRAKIALFFETGINNIMDGVATRNPWANEDNVFQVRPYSAYNNESMKNQYVVPIMVGIKMSFLINVSRINSRCHTCPCYRKR